MNLFKNLIGKTSQLSLLANVNFRQPLAYASLAKSFSSLARASVQSAFVLTSNKNNPTSTFLNQIREYKVKTRLRRRCKSCYFVWRNGRLYVECNEHPRHKQHHKDSMLKGFDSIPNGYIKGKQTI